MRGWSRARRAQLEEEERERGSGAAWARRGEAAQVAGAGGGLAGGCWHTRGEGSRPGGAGLRRRAAQAG